MLVINSLSNKTSEMVYLAETIRTEDGEVELDHLVTEMLVLSLNWLKKPNSLHVNRRQDSIYTPKA